ncbi:unnamed protein product [Thelazia callipaeda]|uniref:Uncharacterized protein n=1 Tax=Thelazia callipaeda TaxID=103827 RepID=A0A0N5D983_THECL|nr:unnamed protein product [Thelazia callipaeda]
MLQGLETYECIFRWSARLTPGFCAPLCLSAFFTQAPLRNVVFWIAFASILCCFCVYAAYHRNNRYLLVPFIAFKCIVFMYLALTIIYDIEYIRYFDAERNIRQQRAEERREEQENIVAEVGIN